MTISNPFVAFPGTRLGRDMTGRPLTAGLAYAEAGGASEAAVAGDVAVGSAAGGEGRDEQAEDEEGAEDKLGPHGATLDHLPFPFPFPFPNPAGSGTGTGAGTGTGRNCCYRPPR